MRIRSKQGPAQPPPTTDQALSSSERGSWRLLNAALGIATVIAPFLPIYRMVGRLDVAIMRSIGLLGWHVVLFLCTYLLPTCVLFYGLRFSSMRQFASSNRGTLPILFGTAVILFFDLAYIGSHRSRYRPVDERRLLARSGTVGDALLPSGAARYLPGLAMLGCGSFFDSASGPPCAA